MGKKLNKKEFIEKAKKIHGNKYDYSKVIYNGSTNKILIICKKHGEFLQESNSHLQGKGCRKCSTEKIAELKRKTLKSFIEESKKIHGNKYDYSLITKYINNKQKVDIICPIHGVFNIRPNEHLTQKQGCSKCGGTKKLTLSEFKEFSNKKHNFKYDYSLITEYINNKQKVDIICPIHGVFVQNTKAHYNGNGCPECKTSKLENEVYGIIKNWNVEIIRNKTHKILKKSKQHFDFYLPKYDIAIECQGKQHYIPVEIFGGEDGFKKTIELDNIKKRLCKENNIDLFEYPYYLTNREKEKLLFKIKKIIDGKDTN